MSGQLDPQQTKIAADHVSDMLKRTIGFISSQDAIIKQTVTIVKQFIHDNGGILYGGMAVNMLLPKDAQFYDESTVPDYDFYIPNARKRAQELAIKLHKAKLPNVQGKSGIHYGTYKVYVDFQAVADVTSMPDFLFDKLKTEVLQVDGLMVAPPDWLRMGMYKELMTPHNFPERWPKIAPRLALLNRYRPYELPKDQSCPMMFDDNGRSYENQEELLHMMDIIAAYVSKHHLILFGATAFNSFVQASRKYSIFSFENYPMRITGLSHVPDFDVFTANVDKDTTGFINALTNQGNIQLSRIKTTSIPAIDHIVPRRITISVDDESLIELYEDEQCIGYINSTVPGQSGQDYQVRIASLPTMLTMWYTWLHTEPDIDKQRERRSKIYCVIEFLLNHQTHLETSPFSIFSQQCGNGSPKSLRSIKRKIYEDNKKPWKYNP